VHATSEQQPLGIEKLNIHRFLVGGWQALPVSCETPLQRGGESLLHLRDCVPLGQIRRRRVALAFHEPRQVFLHQRGGEGDRGPQGPGRSTGPDEEDAAGIRPGLIGAHLRPRESSDEVDLQTPCPQLRRHHPHGHVKVPTQDARPALHNRGGELIPELLVGVCEALLLSCRQVVHVTVANDHVGHVAPGLLQCHCDHENPTASGPFGLSFGLLVCVHVAPVCAPSPQQQGQLGHHVAPARHQVGVAVLLAAQAHPAHLFPAPAIAGVRKLRHRGCGTAAAAGAMAPQHPYQLWVRLLQKQDCGWRASDVGVHVCLHVLASAPPVPTKNAQDAHVPSKQIRIAHLPRSPPHCSFSWWGRVTKILSDFLCHSVGAHVLGVPRSAKQRRLG